MQPWSLAIGNTIAIHDYITGLKNSSDYQSNFITASSGDCHSNAAGCCGPPQHYCSRAVFSHTPISTCSQVTAIALLSSLSSVAVLGRTHCARHTVCDQCDCCHQYKNYRSLCCSYCSHCWRFLAWPRQSMCILKLMPTLCNGCVLENAANDLLKSGQVRFSIFQQRQICGSLPIQY